MSDILYGVKRLVLTELDPLTQLPRAGGIKCVVTTAQEANLDPVISNGDEKILRDDDIVLAIARTPDLCYGYNFKFKDATFDLKVASLIEGGKIIFDAVVLDKVIGYDSPMLADGATMKPFMAEVYVANYKGDSIVNYACIRLNNCSGKAPKMEFKKDFFAPEFEVDAREATIAVLPMKQVTYVDVLPSTGEVVKPILTLTSTASVVKPAGIVASSNELGGIYAIDSDAIVTSVTDLQRLITLKLGAYAPITTIGLATTISTTTLNADKYKVYAVDLEGNISLGSIVITLT